MNNDTVWYIAVHLNFKTWCVASPSQQESSSFQSLTKIRNHIKDISCHYAICDNLTLSRCRGLCWKCLVIWIWSGAVLKPLQSKSTTINHDDRLKDVQPQKNAKNIFTWGVQVDPLQFETLAIRAQNLRETFFSFDVWMGGYILF